MQLPSIAPGKRFTAPPDRLGRRAAAVSRIAAGSSGGGITFMDVLPIIIGLWTVSAVQRAIGAYQGFGRDLFVRRVQLEAERRLLAKASTVDLGHFDNSDWHDRLARAKRDVSWRPGDLTWSVLGLSGNFVTILLMAGILASLNWTLVVLALVAAILSLLLERRNTVRMYEYFYKETPEEREREYLGNLLVEPKSTKEIRAYVLSEHLLGRHRRLSEELLAKRTEMYRAGANTSMITGLVTGTGPMNRGVEISSDVADDHSVILDQVTNGVAVRMAVMFLLSGGQKAEA